MLIDQISCVVKFMTIRQPENVSLTIHLILIKGHEVETAHEAAQIFLNYSTCAQVKVEWMCHRAHYGCVFFPVFVSPLFRYCWCLGL